MFPELPSDDSMAVVKPHLDAALEYISGLASCEKQDDRLLLARTERLPTG